MARGFPDAFVQEVIAATDIIDLISGYVTLKKSGGRYLGLCPFHREKTPSFNVTPDKQLFYCFGCEEGGSALQFIMRTENLSFGESVELLAERAGLALPQGIDGKDEHYKKLKEIIEINTKAARFFCACLAGEKGSGAREYIQKRGIAADTARHFGLGYAPDEWSGLIDHLNGEHDIGSVIDAGLAVKNEKGNVYDRFRNRLMFPIIDIKGNVIGFGGRVMDQSTPKYLNSPETLAFDKSKNLFALNFARRQSRDSIIIAEGYMDTIALHQAGISNAVATLGTALTREQARIISRCAKTVVLAYDGDGAGQKATVRAIKEIFPGLDVRLKVLCLPGAKDPDEFIRSFGAERFKELLDQAASSTAYLINGVRERYDIEDTDQKIYFVNEVSALLADIGSRVERDAYIKKVSDETGISPDAVDAEVRRITNKQMKKQVMARVPVKPAADERADLSGIQTRDGSLLKAEQGLLTSLVTDKGVYMRFKDQINEQLFTYPLHKDIARLITDRYDRDESVDFASVISALPDRAKEVGKIFYKNDCHGDPIMYVNDCISLIKDKQHELELKLNIRDNDADDVSLGAYMDRLKRKKDPLCRKGGIV